MKKRYPLWGIVFMFTLFSGCSSIRGNVGTMSIYKIPDQEAEWIRNGEPLLFEGESWYPQDRVDLFLDSEVARVGEYKGVQIFISQEDVRPYRRLYTKFSYNKFRVFKKKTDDKNNAAR